MRGFTARRAAWALAGVAITGLTVPLAAKAQAAVQRSYNIPSQDLAGALDAFGRQSGKDILFDRRQVAGKTSRPVKGSLDAGQALRKLLSGSGLSVTSPNAETFVVGTSQGAAQRPAEAPQGARAAAADPDEQGEIIVTATRRETTLLETATAVSAVGAAEIEKRRLVGMEDYLAAIPGVSYQDRGVGANTITIRGIGLGSQFDPNSAVGSYFGETPVNSLGTPANGLQGGNADIKMVDVARVEVLRGPQGTLYGAGSMGGTVRLIPNAPDLNSVEGIVAAEYSVTGRRGGSNYMVQAVANVPLIEDRLAIRLVGYRFDNDGYIDNVAGSTPNSAIRDAVAIGVVAKDKNHVGREIYTGMRASVLWKPVEDLSITLSHLYQDIDQDGFKFVQTELPGKYQQSRAQVGFAGMDYEYATQSIWLSNLTMEYKTDWGSFLNSTSKILQKGTSDIEFSLFGPPFLGISAPNRNRRDIWVNEFRFVSDFDGPLQAIAGVYYEDRKFTSLSTTIWNGIPLNPDAYFELLDVAQDQKQLAAFGELAFTPWDPVTLTVGARYFDFTQEIVRSRNIDVPDASEGQKASVNGVNWKVNLAYKFSPEIFAYAQWAQGFREPRFQGVIRPEYDADNDGLIEFRDGIERKVTAGLLDPDTVDNYEIGLKYQSADRRLQGSLTAFRIDWQGIPVVPALTAYEGQVLYFNAGKARSMGIEFEASVEPADGLIFQLAASYINAELSEDAPSLGPKGADLPGSADWNVHASVEKQFDLGGHDAFVRGDYTYVSKYYNSLAEAGTPSGNYHVFDLNAGVTLDNFKLGVFVKNLTNRDDFTWIDNAFGFDLAYRLRPRTIGVNLAARF